MLDADKKLDELVLTGLLRLNAKVQGVVTGILLGFAIFLATNWLLIKGGTIGPEGKTTIGPHLSLLGQYFIGYKVTFLGSLIGFTYGFAVGFIGGYFISTMYNWLVDRKDHRSTPA